jgi:hypothetical protein
MFRTRFSRQQEELLPWYTNGTLTAAEREAVERWLRQSPEAPAKLAGWQRLRTAVTSQAQQTPSPSVWQQVMARVQARRATGQQTRVSLRPAWAWGAALAAAVLILLWSTIQPGIVLQWSVSDGPLTAFRVYRAPLGSASFDLLHEVPAHPDVQRYTYVDAQLWPAQTYVYRVEGVRQGGQPALSQTITASALDALPGQLAILFTSLIVGYGAVILVQRWQSGSQGSWGLSRLMV